MMRRTARSPPRINENEEITSVSVSTILYTPDMPFYLLFLNFQQKTESKKRNFWQKRHKNSFKILSKKIAFLVNGLVENSFGKSCISFTIFSIFFKIFFRLIFPKLRKKVLHLKTPKRHT